MDFAAYLICVSNNLIDVMGERNHALLRTRQFFLPGLSCSMETVYMSAGNVLSIKKHWQPSE